MQPKACSLHRRGWKNLGTTSISLLDIAGLTSGRNTKAVILVSATDHMVMAALPLFFSDHPLWIPSPSASLPAGLALHLAGRPQASPRTVWAVSRPAWTGSPQSSGGLTPRTRSERHPSRHLGPRYAHPHLHRERRPDLPLAAAVTRPSQDRPSPLACGLGGTRGSKWPGWPSQPQVKGALSRLLMEHPSRP